MRTANTLAAVLVSALVPGLAIAAEIGKPLKVLCVVGGGWHDYATQSQTLKQGIEARVRSQVDVAYSAEPSGKATFDIYGNPDWAKGYDVVIHDECSCDVIDPAYIERILAAHRRGTPAVNLHCAMHSYRRGDFRQPVKAGADNAAWFEMLGLQSTRHGPQLPIEVTFTDRGHPIAKRLADWKTINEELYNTVQVQSGCVAA